MLIKRIREDSWPFGRRSQHFRFLGEFVLFEISCSLVSLLLFHFYARTKLPFRFVLYTLLSNDFQNIICFIYFISGGIQAKCDQVSTLLKVIQERTEEFHGLIKNLYRLQRSVCTPLQIGHISLSAIGLACGEGVRAAISRNIPYIEKSSRTLFLMYKNQERTVCVAASFNKTRKVVAPVVGKQATSGIAKQSSLCIIGAAAIFITILVDVKMIADNTAALNQEKRSDLVTRLEDAANKMETEMNNFITKYGPIVGG
jgi:hypothetical protein